MNKFVSELQIGDNIELFKGKYGCGTVIKKDKDSVTIIRPYIHMVTTPICDENGKYLRSEVLEYGIPAQGISTISNETVKLYDSPTTNWLVLS